MGDGFKPLIEDLWNFWLLVEKKSGESHKIILNFYLPEFDLRKNNVPGGVPVSSSFRCPDKDVSDWAQNNQFEVLPKVRQEFEVYILYNNGGFLEGPYTGWPEKIPGKTEKFTGRLEELRKTHIIHLLFPEEYLRLLDLCEISENYLRKKGELLRKYPLLSLATDLYSSYLHATYSSSSKQAKSAIVELLESIAQKKEVQSFLAASAELEENHGKETRTCIYAVEDGKFKIFNSRSKRKRRCLNSWMFGEQASAGKSVEKPEERKFRNYEKIIESLGYYDRMTQLLEEGKLLIGEKYPPDLVDALADLKEGSAFKILENIAKIASVPDIANKLQPQQLKSSRQLLIKSLTYIRLVEKFPSLVESYGIQPENVRHYAGVVLKLAREFQVR